MKAFGSRRVHAEWRWTRKHLKKVTASKPLRIKSHKTGRQFEVSLEE